MERDSHWWREKITTLFIIMTSESPILLPTLEQGSANYGKLETCGFSVVPMVSLGQAHRIRPPSHLSAHHSPEASNCFLLTNDSFCPLMNDAV